MRRSRSSVGVTGAARWATALLAVLLAGCASSPVRVTFPDPATTSTTVPDTTTVPPGLVIKPTIGAIGDCSPLPEGVDPPAPGGAMQSVGPIVFFFEEGVGGRDRERAATGGEVAQRYLDESLGGFRFDEPVCMDVRAGTSGSLTVGVVYGANHVVVYVGGAAVMQGPSWLLPHIVSHEYVHFWQRDLGAPHQASGPVWLVEGAAELVAYQAVVAGGLTTYDEGRAYSLRRLVPGSPTLQSMERRALDPEQFSYALSFLATEFLTRGPGVASLAAYWRGLSRGMPWEAAFTAAFGTPPADFYAAFDDHRRLGFPR